MQADREYWSVRMEPPYGPSDGDVDTYKRLLLPGTTLLLGCTHLLIPLTDEQMDIDPWYQADTVRVGNWRDNDRRYTNIIGDGVINLTGELCHNIIDMASRCSERLIVRSFTRKLPNMRVADHFPAFDQLRPRPTLARHQSEYSFFVWDFK